ncbi:MAG TPA: TetR/AcrR family transcriptional regulator [Candidatus Micrarchaeaceae archaeon]|nr:TetR/AcrR family transcriptional regulator [Candidatus Micrarchaeaceae archaeon]
MAVARRGERRAEEIRLAALELFYRRGFQASTLRGVAAKVGIQVGSLYNHIGSKSDLLFEIMEGVMLDLLADQQEAVATPDIVERMRLLVERHVMFHGRRSREVFVGNSELRSLSLVRRTRIIELRHEYEMVFRKELDAGIRQGKFLPSDVQVTSYGILALATSVSAFYSPRGRLSLEQIAGIYSAMVLRGLWNPQAGTLPGQSSSGSHNWV